jgi:hypothetical protein
MAKILLSNQCDNSGGLIMVNDWLELTPDSIWLEIPTDIQEESWAKSAALTDASTRQRVYINLLCQQVILNYLQSEIPSASLVENQEDFWQLGVNGFALKLGGKLVIVIARETLDIEAMEIPQEWVDIPQLIGDYYLAVQVNTAENYLRIWGYTSHKDIKEKGQYLKRNLNYSLPRNQVKSRLNSFLLETEAEPSPVTIDSQIVIKKLSLDRLTNLLDILANPELIFPRKAIAFEEWATVIVNNNWRKILITCRQKPPVKLTNWFADNFPIDWQSLVNFNSLPLVPAFKNTEIKRIKDLGLELLGNPLALMITIGKIQDNFSVQASVYSTGERTTLPPQLKLIILTETGEIFQEVNAKDNDEFIRYRFDAELGDKFIIEVALESTKVSEYFQV